MTQRPFHALGSIDHKVDREAYGARLCVFFNIEVCRTILDFFSFSYVTSLIAAEKGTRISTKAKRLGQASDDLATNVLLPEKENRMIRQ